MLQRILVAVVGIPLLLFVLIIAPDWATALLLCALCTVGAHELLAAACRKELCRRWWGLSAIMGVTVVLRTYLAGIGQDGAAALMEWLLAAWLVLLFVSVVVEYGTPRALAFRDVCTILMAGIAIPLAFQCLMQLRLMEHGGGLVMIPLVAAFSSDSAALFAGMALGRHKLAPAVSPKKTVEGSIGGLAGGMLGIVIFRIVFFLVREVQLNIAWCVLLGLVGAVLGQLGDLSFSAIKRECGVKDYGRLLPGHGGVLDRFDSVIFASPVVWLLIKSITLY